MDNLNGILILIVDDEPDIRELLGSYLEDLGATIYFADNGDEGFKIAQTTPIDIILSDLLMKGSGGLTLLKRLRALSSRRIPVFLSTGNSELSEKEAKELGADGLFIKPYEMSAIKQSILKAIRKV